MGYLIKDSSDKAKKQARAFMLSDNVHKRLEREWLERCAMFPLASLNLAESFYMNPAECSPLDKIKVVEHIRRYNKRYVQFFIINKTETRWEIARIF